MVKKNTQNRVSVIESVGSEGATGGNARVSCSVNPKIKTKRELKAHMESIFDFIIQNGYGCDSDGACYDDTGGYKDDKEKYSTKPWNLCTRKVFEILRTKPLIKKKIMYIINDDDQPLPDFLGRLYVRPINVLPRFASKYDLSSVKGKLKKVNLHKCWFLEVLGFENFSELTKFADDLSKKYKVDIDIFQSTNESHEFNYYGTSAPLCGY